MSDSKLAGATGGKQLFTGPVSADENLLKRLQEIENAATADIGYIKKLEEENKKLAQENAKLKYRVNILVRSLTEAEQKGAAATAESKSQ